MPITILLIDDDQKDRTYWSNALRTCRYCYAVLEADSGEAGFNLFREHAVNCVVLDLDMPEIGFFVLLRLMCERKSPVAVVVLTRLVHPILGQMMKDNGAYACLVKQHSSAEDLAHTIQQAMAAVGSKQKGDA